MLGCEGADESMTKPRAGLELDALPAGSVATATTWCAPSGNDGNGQVHVPLAEATTVQAGVVEPSTKTVTVLPASAVPVTVGLDELVAPSVGAVMTGAAGAVESTVKCRGAVAADALLAASVATAVT